MDPEAGLTSLFREEEIVIVSQTSKVASSLSYPSCLAAEVNGLSMSSTHCMSPNDESLSLSLAKALR